ncbi:MAG: hypothetical protein PHT97_08810 [Methanoculleus sp.]|uniref:hypothetical protein n=1 Tax=Methanoculleus sp. TaxID=90427 RepID=UPI0025ECCC62|nr:hypothetical protein [Methanoculleus sp.]MCK9318395.1 hypothetical protein [Methanoculleus sp.]MDD2254435.1 hypothetical protein [Methanoculleus sp.]MDD3216887.1 hypothetical protein [Methanoculleus sp.]MDD4314953.1 hypothetical protein [Methanoculleus sp.]MDD4471237.1 hypothetical protein [Methanoculleus sp.]
MKDRWLVLGIAVVVVFALWRASYVPPGYETIDYETVPVLPVEWYNPPILEIWGAMEEQIPFDNRTAKSPMLVMDFDANGSFTYIQFGFFADMEGDPWVHSAFVLRNGSAYLSSQRLDHRPPHAHPLGALAAVDDIPFDELSYGKGMSLKVFYHEQNRTYDDTYNNIYAIENGTLRPLEFISFATTEVWHTIEIYPVDPPDENRTPTAIDQDPRALVVFPPREIGLAERVVYA